MVRRDHAVSRKEHEAQAVDRQTASGVRRHDYDRCGYDEVLAEQKRQWPLAQQQFHEGIQLNRSLSDVLQREQRIREIESNQGEDKSRAAAGQQP